MMDQLLSFLGEENTIWKSVNSMLIEGDSDVMFVVKIKMFWKWS